jgi:hypothetical protein
MIELKFTAATWAELEEKLLEAAGRIAKPPAPDADYNAMITTLNENEARLAEVRKKPGRKKAQELSPTQAVQENQVEEASPGASPEEPTQETPGPQESLANGAGASPEPAIEQEVAEQRDTTDLPTKELLELKEKVIDALQSEYRAGKVQKVRDFLVRYGKGVKSFRQISIDDFPGMDKAIREGALG